MLINLVSIHPSPTPQSLPLATAFLKAYAAEFKDHIVLTDFFINKGKQYCLEKLLASNATAIGFSIYIWNREYCLDILKSLKILRPELIIFCGGPEVTAVPANFIDSGLFDFIICGEGEIPFYSFCKAISTGNDYTQIKGIISRETIKPSTAETVINLDDVPSPYSDGTIDLSETSGILWQLSRGCSFTCDFCFDARGQHGVRRFSLQRIEEELILFSKSAVLQVFVLDSTFNLDKKRAKNILRLIKRHTPDIHFHFEVRSEFIDDELAELFAQISCSLQVGLQSSSKDVLALVSRNFSSVDFTTKIGLLNQHGATFGFDLIYGLPGDTLQGFRASIDFAISLYPNHLDIFPLAVLPGTSLSNKAENLSLEFDKSPPYLLHYSPTFSLSDMAEAGKLATACDIFYTRGKAVAWFNAVLLALNCTASAFFDKFSNWMLSNYNKQLNESELTDESIYKMQIKFLKLLLNKGRHRQLLPGVIDIVTYHYHYAAVLQKPPVTATCDYCITKRDGIALSNAARIWTFSYDIDELLEMGEPRFAWICKNIRQSDSYIIIYNSAEGIKTESLPAEYYRLIKDISLYGSVYEAGKYGLTETEVSEFMKFVFDEGITVYR